MGVDSGDNLLGLLLDDLLVGHSHLWRGSVLRLSVMEHGCASEDWDGAWWGAWWLDVR